MLVDCHRLFANSSRSRTLRWPFLTQEQVPTSTSTEYALEGIRTRINGFTRDDIHRALIPGTTFATPQGALVLEL